MLQHTENNLSTLPRLGRILSSIIPAQSGAIAERDAMNSKTWESICDGADAYEAISANCERCGKIGELDVDICEIPFMGYTRKLCEPCANAAYSSGEAV